MINILSIIVGIVICVIVDLILKPWAIAYSKKWGEISAQLATKDDLNKITHSIESTKKNAEIDTQLVRKEDLKEITEAIESVKLDLEQKNIEYQLRYSKVYEKSMLELSNIICEFISLSEKLLKHSNAMRLSKSQAFSEYDHFGDEILSVKIKIKSSMIWLPNDIAVYIDQQLITINKKYNDILQDLSEKNAHERNEIVLNKIRELLRVIISSENNILDFINSSRFYSVDQFLK